MTDRTAAELVGESVKTQLAARSIAIDTLATATDFTVADLDDRLEGRFPFTVRELVKVGGFLHFAPSRFLEGVRA